MRNVFCVTIGLLILATLSYGQEIDAFEAESDESKWVSHLFDAAEIVHLEQTPYELMVLPGQLEEVGLDASRLVFGRNFAPFGRLEEAFENAVDESPVSAEALTEWMESWHGASVHTRVYRIGDNGYIVGHVSPYIFIADLGNYEEAVALRDELIAMNQ